MTGPPSILVSFKDANKSLNLVEQWHDAGGTPVPDIGHCVVLDKLYRVIGVVWSNEGAYYQVDVYVEEG
jgi:hypothetical protein